MQESDRFQIPWNNSLITRSLMSLLVLMALTVVSMGYFYTTHQRQEEKGRLLQDGQYISRIAALTLALPVWNLDAEQAQRQLMAMNDNNRFCGARIYDAQQQLFVDAGFPAILSEHDIVRSEKIFYNNPTRDRALPEWIGTLELCMTTQPMERKLGHMFREQLIFLGLVVLSGLGACYFALMVFLRPLRKFRQAMAQLAETMQPIADPELLKRNEIGELTHSFNRMTQDLARIYGELRSAKERAESADQAKSNFLANMTHELRTPLNSIIGMVNLLRERSLNAEDQEMLSVVYQASAMLLETVNAILDISKIEAGQMQLANVGFDPESLIRRVVATLKPLAKRKRLALECRFAQKLPYLLGDPLRFSQIVTNLVSNAINYTDHGEVTVEVSASELGPGKLELQCRVVDTGIGIPADKLGAIFRKFTQIESSSNRRQGGTGLGLAITRELVERMHGVIKVESIPGRGSIFWFCIPFAVTDTLGESQDWKRHRHKRIVQPIAASQANVLVAEDHLLNQALMRRLLVKYGFSRVDLVENGWDVLAALSEKEYHMILMDCFMPELDGYEATRLIREQEKITSAHMPIIAMTANAMAGEAERCLEAGMDDYIPKPIMENDFIEVLSQWIAFEQLPPAGPPEPQAPRMVSSIVNLATLYTYSHGDRKVEQELLNIFMQQSDRHLEKLHTLCIDGESEAWVETAHVFKGGSGSVGAWSLRDLCAQAQSMHTATEQARKMLAEEIDEAYAAVKKELRRLGYTTSPEES